jgi:hypothetical protein
MTKERLGLKLRHELPNPGLLVTKLQQTDPWTAGVAGVLAGLGHIASESCSGKNC